MAKVNEASDLGSLLGGGGNDKVLPAEVGQVQVLEPGVTLKATRVLVVDSIKQNFSKTTIVIDQVSSVELENGRGCTINFRNGLQTRISDHRAQATYEALTTLLTGGDLENPQAGFDDEFVVRINDEGYVPKDIVRSKLHKTAPDEVVKIKPPPSPAEQAAANVPPDRDIPARA